MQVGTGWPCSYSKLNFQPEAVDSVVLMTNLFNQTCVETGLAASDPVLYPSLAHRTAAHPPVGRQYIPSVLFEPQYHRPTLPLPILPAHPSSSPEHESQLQHWGHHPMRRKLNTSCSSAEPKELPLTCANQCPGEFTQRNHLTNTSNLQFQ